MKTSNKILLTSFILCFLFTLGFAFFVKSDIAEYQGQKIESRISVPGQTASMNYLQGAIDFKYIWTDFSEVRLEIDTVSKVNISPSFLQYVGLHIQADTLYILEREFSNYEGKALSMSVKKSQLAGREVVGLGKVISNFYDSEEELQAENFEILLREGGTCYTSVACENLRAKTLGKGNLFLSGSTNVFDVEHSLGNISAFDFLAKETSIKINNGLWGRIETHTSSRLHAELQSNMDVMYLGEPAIEKVEKGFGRLIDANVLLSGLKE
ncbi:MAG: DUF2807 domain-containing protein [Bacteroidota bacterium]